MLFLRREDRADLSVTSDARGKHKATYGFWDLLLYYRSHKVKVIPHDSGARMHSKIFRQSVQKSGCLKVSEPHPRVRPRSCSSPSFLNKEKATCGRFVTSALLVLV